MKIYTNAMDVTLSKTMQKVPTSPKICASTTLGNLR